MGDQVTTSTPRNDLDRPSTICSCVFFFATMLHISIIFGIIFLSFASGYAPFKQSKSLQPKLDPVLQARNIFQAKEKPSAPFEVTKRSSNFFSEEYLKRINLPDKLTIARALSVPIFALTFTLRLVRAWCFSRMHFLYLATVLLLLL